MGCVALKWFSTFVATAPRQASLWSTALDVDWTVVPYSSSSMIYGKLIFTFFFVLNYRAGWLAAAGEKLNQLLPFSSHHLAWILFRLNHWLEHCCSAPRPDANNAARIKFVWIITTTACCSPVIVRRIQKCEISPHVGVVDASLLAAIDHRPVRQQLFSNPYLGWEKCVKYSTGAVYAIEVKYHIARAPRLRRVTV